jgi:glyoxylase-like metal-dependent hydrolase (beta-lactamase superfamily II)
MIKLKRLVVGQLKTNCYLVFDDESKAAIIIDPGDDGDYIIRKISDLGLIPQKIIATHGHFDHILAATELQLAYGIPFLLHKKDEFLLSRMGNSAKHFLGVKTDPAPVVDHYLTEGEKVKIRNFQPKAGHPLDEKLEIIETPGHTPGSISLYDKLSKFAFVGDLFFADGSLGRSDFKYSDKDALSKSIKKVLKLDDNTIIYPGHGEEMKVKNLKEARSQLDSALHI